MTTKDDLLAPRQSRRFWLAFGGISVWLAISLCGCATKPTVEVKAMVWSDHVEFEGVSYPSREEFYRALLASPATIVQVIAAPGTDYAHLASAVAAVQQAGRGRFIVSGIMAPGGGAATEVP